MRSLKEYIDRAKKYDIGDPFNSLLAIITIILTFIVVLHIV